MHFRWQGDLFNLCICVFHSFRQHGDHDFLIRLQLWTYFTVVHAFWGVSPVVRLNTQYTLCALVRSHTCALSLVAPIEARPVDLTYLALAAHLWLRERFSDRRGQNPAVWYFLLSGSTSCCRRTWEPCLSFVTWWVWLIVFLGPVFGSGRKNKSHMNLVPELEWEGEGCQFPATTAKLTLPCPCFCFVYACVCASVSASYLITCDDRSMSTMSQNTTVPRAVKPWYWKYRCNKSSL